MKTLKIQLEPIAWLLAIVMVVQSCTVYKSTPLTLEQAVQKESKVRVTTNSNERFKFKKVVFEDGKYYGVRKFTREKFRVQINEDSVKSIDEINQTLSVVKSLMPFVVIGGLYLGLKDNCCY